MNSEFDDEITLFSKGLTLNIRVLCFLIFFVQVLVLGEGLDVHARIAPDALNQFHKRMEQLYDQLRSKYLPQAERRSMVRGLDKSVT